MPKKGPGINIPEIASDSNIINHRTRDSGEEYLGTIAHTKCARPESKATLKIYFLTAYYTN